MIKEFLIRRGVTKKFCWKCIDEERCPREGLQPKRR